MKLGTIGHRIKVARHNIGLTQVQFALKCKCTQKQISLIENGLTQPTITTLVKFANVLKLPPSFFLE